MGLFLHTGESGKNSFSVILKKNNEGIKWYGKAAKQGHVRSIINLGNVYHEQSDDIRAAAYFLALIAYDEPKADIFDFLQNDWKINQETLQKAYKLQQTLDIPKHYTGGID